MNVLFVGGGRRVALARRFKAKGHRVYAYELGYSVPVIKEASIIKGKRWDDPDIEDHFVKMVEKRGIDLILPLMDRAVVLCAGLDIPNVVNLVSSVGTATICYDKKLFATFMERNFPSLYPSIKLGRFPRIQKPRYGFGSQNIKVIKNVFDFSLDTMTSEKFIVQNKIEGIEYSVDTYYNKDSKWVDSVPRERIRIGSGEVITSRTVDKPMLALAAKEIGEGLGLIGPANLQFIEQDDKQFFLIEVNARFGGGWTLSMEAGLDAISLIECEYFNKPYKYEPYRWRRDLLLERSYEDHFFDS